MFKAIISSAALVAAMTFTGAASAQTYMLDGLEIPGDRVQDFAEKCEAIQASVNASLTESADPTETGSTSSGQATSPDPASIEHWDEALAALSVEECNEAGFTIVNR